MGNGVHIKLVWGVMLHPDYSDSLRQDDEVDEFNDAWETAMDVMRKIAKQVTAEHRSRQPIDVAPWPGIAACRNNEAPQPFIGFAVGANRGMGRMEGILELNDRYAGSFLDFQQFLVKQLSDRKIMIAQQALATACEEIAQAGWIRLLQQSSSAQWILSIDWD